MTAKGKDAEGKKASAKRKAPAKGSATARAKPAGANGTANTKSKPTGKKTASPAKKNARSAKTAPAGPRKKAATRAPAPAKSGKAEQENARARKSEEEKAKPGNADAGKAKPANGGAAPDRSIFHDYDTLTEYLTEVTGASQDVVSEFFANNPALKTAVGDAPADPLNIGDAFQEMMKGLAADPGTVMQRQFNLWGDYAKLMGTMSRRLAGEEVKPAVAPEPGDRRFRHEAWEANPMLDFVKQSYLVFSRWLERTVESVEGLDPHEKAKAEFYTRQFTDAFAPSNFAMLNPEVVEETIETRGENLFRGLKNLLEDIDRGHGQLAIRQADLDYFELGENVATTPGKVVFQNEIMQLIQYEATTDEVARTPMLIVPPWINKFYILDLQPENSFIKWLVDQGRTVFVISWVNPEPKLRDKTFEDYIHDGLFAALEAVKNATGERKSDVIGYCIGGTMLSMALSYMAKRGDDRVNSATFFTAQADFSEAGDLLLFVDDQQLAAIEKQMDAAGGVLEGRAMATTFNMLRSNDLIWSFVIDNYLKGKDPAKFDLLFWNSDATRMPKGVHLFYLREFYQKNLLARGEMEMDGVRLDLGEVSVPIFMQAGEADHIAPHNSVYKTARLFASGDNDQVTYMLAGSGHIAGVVNHPSRNKYHHSINEALPERLEDWKAGATRHDGSWWPHWIGWLAQVSPGKTKARRIGEGELKAIEDAPGSYVKVKA